MDSRDPFHDHPLVHVMREHGFDVLHMSHSVRHGGLAHSGHATVFVGGLPVGEMVRDEETGRWEFRSGDPDLPFLTARRRQRPPQGSQAPGGEQPVLVAFGAVCSAWDHPDGVRGVWYGPMRATFDEAKADAATHEHPAEAYVTQVDP